MLSFTAEPYFVVSENLVKNCLLSKHFYQIFDIIVEFYLILQSLLPFLNAIISSILQFYFVFILIYSAFGCRSVGLAVFLVIGLNRHQFYGESTALLCLLGFWKSDLTVKWLHSLQIGLVSQVIFVAIIVSSRNQANIWCLCDLLCLLIRFVDRNWYLVRFCWSWNFRHALGDLIMSKFNV